MSSRFFMVVDLDNFNRILKVMMMTIMMMMMIIMMMMKIKIAITLSI